MRQLESEGCRAMAVQADVSDRAQVNAMVRRVEEAFGPVSLLVNNAGHRRTGAVSGDHGRAVAPVFLRERRRRVPYDSGGAAAYAARARGLHRERLVHLGAARRELRGDVLLHEGRR